MPPLRDSCACRSREAGAAPADVRARWSAAVVTVDDVIDGYVDHDIPQPGLVAEGCRHVALDVAGDLVCRVAVADRDGQVHDRRAAEHPDGGVRVPVPEGGLLGERGDLAVSAAAEGNPH